MQRATGITLVLALWACSGTADWALAPTGASGAGPSGSDAGSADAGPTAPVAGGGDGGRTDAGSATDAGPADAGTADPCAPLSCPALAHCERAPVAHCACSPGFTLEAGGCVPADPQDPLGHTAAQICAAVAEGNRHRTATPFSKSAATCDPGTLSRDGLDDGLARLNLHRWLVGLSPVTDTQGDNAAAQACALTSAWNPAGPAAHSPAPTATCYTALGAAGAGSSNIAWGSADAADAMDQWIIDNGNQDTLGHRKWLFNPPLGPVGVGFYQGGISYGSSACIRVFNSSGGGRRPSWWAYPPQGLVPAQYANWPWSIHGALPAPPRTVSVTRQRDGAALGATVHELQGGYGMHEAVGVDRSFQVQQGETYLVTLSGSAGAPISYALTPIACP